MKTNFKITKQAFKDWFITYMESKNHNEQIEELMLIFENNDSRYYENFMKNKRVKAHSAAFYSVIIAIRPFMEKGYYADNAQIKKLIKEFTGKDYKDYLADLVIMIEESRDELLEEMLNNN